MVKPAHPFTTVLLLCLMDSIGRPSAGSPLTYRSVLLSVVHLSLRTSQSAGVSPLLPCSRKLLDETVKVLAVFPSHLLHLHCDDSCKKSVPLRTSDLHYSRWQSGEICQELSTGAFTLLCRVFIGFCEGLFLLFLVVLPTRLSARCFPSSRPDTASIRSCLLLPPGFFDTREAGI